MQDSIGHEPLADRWRQYNQTRLSGDKKTANKHLVEFIQRLQQRPETEIRQFVDYVCGEVLDVVEGTVFNNGLAVSEAKVRIQHPLFRDVILPALMEQYLRGSARHILWIGQLEQFFYSDVATWARFLTALGMPGHFCMLHFFIKSYELEPSQRTLRILLNKLAQRIDRSLWDFPHTVLVVPEVLNEELALFRTYWQQAANKDEWLEALAFWTFAADGWAQYRAAPEAYDSYEACLRLRITQAGATEFLPLLENTVVRYFFSAPPAEEALDGG